MKRLNRLLCMLLVFVLVLSLLPGLRLTAGAISSITITANNFPDANFRAFV